VKAVDLDAVKTFHAKFYGASHAELAIVGDFDAAAVRPLVRELFGDFKSATAYARVPQPFYPTKAEPQTFETPDKANAAMFGRLAMPLNDETPDYAALLAASDRCSSRRRSTRTARSSSTRSSRRRTSRASAQSPRRKWHARATPDSPSRK
jgi:predicted Zn-dependent peptidase